MANVHLPCEAASPLDSAAAVDSKSLTVAAHVHICPFVDVWPDLTLTIYVQYCTLMDS